MEPGPKVIIVDVVDGLRDDDDSHGDGEDVNFTFCHSKNVDRRRGGGRCLMLSDLKSTCGEANNKSDDGDDSHVGHGRDCCL